jgi:quercetin dioxygenase-like cupin family protein
MSTLSENITHISRKQKTIDALLGAGDLKKKNGDNSGWVLEPIHSDKDCDMGLVYIDTVEAGRCKDHIHEESVEYLVVVKGSILFNIDGTDVRIVEEGEMATVPPGRLHHSKPLEDGTKLAYICVPRDPGMTKLISGGV